MVVFPALQNAHPVAHDGERIGRKIVERADLLRVAGGKIAVHAAKRQVIGKALHVAAQRLHDGAVRGLFLNFLRRAGEAFEHFLAPAGGKRGQHLSRGQDGERLDILRAALGRKVEFAHRVHLVVEKFDAHGRAERRVDIQNPAAQGKLPHALDRFGADVADLDKLSGKGGKVEARADLDLRHRAAQERGRQRALHQRIDRGDEHARFPGGKAAERADALLLPAVRGGDAVAQLPFAREEKACLFAEQRGEVERHAVCLVFVGAEHEKRPLRLLAQRGGELRAVHACKARHGDGTRPRVDVHHQLAHLGQRRERRAELFHPLCHADTSLRNAQKGRSAAHAAGRTRTYHDAII